jgi:two-component system cell cycle sensor histidine kinase PleC
LLAAISHEIRTPLTAVLGFCDLMGREVFGPVGDPRYSAYLRHIADGGAALLKSAEDTLAFSALLAQMDRTKSKSDVRIDTLVANVIATIAPLASAQQVTIAVDVPAGLAALGDGQTFRQVLTNLALEAIGRTEAGGTVRILAHVKDGGVSLQLMSDRIGLVTGPTSRASLGLSIARALVEISGGALSIEIDPPTAAWRADLRLDAASQPDLFRD